MTAVSVVIPTYNRAGLVCRALTSVLYQDFGDCEILVVDDGSTDHTPERLKRFGSLLKVLRHPQNRGVSAARNTGIMASCGDFIAFLDSDDYWLPGKLSAQVDFFRRHPKAVACQTQERWIRRGRRVNPMKKHLKPSGDIFEPSLKLCLVSPSSVMLRRTLLHEVGLFDESLPACEDYDLWLRISCRYPVHLIDRTLVVKEGGAPDQLSATVEGLDRFRIQSMTKLIRSGILSREQLANTLHELSVKCRIYGNGRLKRGNREEGQYYLSLPEKVEQELKGGP
jgi:glycosyltransferase involved in cell wall biosynthesis